VKLTDLLHEMVAREASDLHIKAGSPPGLRIQGKLQPIAGWAPLSAKDCHALVDELLPDECREDYEKSRQADFSKGIDGVARFRVNVFHQRGSRAAVLRRVPLKAPMLEEMGYPPAVEELCRKPRGLVLVTGPTGSGKSTTLAAMIHYINRMEPGHILTLEDPIEFLHTDVKCYVNQREIGSDSPSFKDALRAALREDPDYILVGELRDLETISLAVTAAETGHMVFGTLHTSSAPQTIDRVIDVFAHEAQQQIRTQLSLTLQGVISQTLVPRVGGGRVCAQEIMVATDAVRSCIRDGKSSHLGNFLQTGARYGMQTLESCLAKLVIQGLVAPEQAISKANHPALLEKELERAGLPLPQLFAHPPEPPPETSPANPKPPPIATSRQATVGRDATPVRERSASGTGTAADDFERFRARRKENA